jgi:hypothetical protein
MNHMPNYLQELYVLFLPLGALTFRTVGPLWTLLNCLFTIILVLILSRIYALDRPRTLLLALLLLIGTPFRVVLGSGAMTLLELLLFCLVFYDMGRIKRGIALGLSYSKYSFSPPLFLYLAFRRQYKLLAISLVPPLLGLLMMWFLVRGNPVTLAVEPLIVSRIGVFNGMGDLMSIIHTLFDTVLSVPAIGRLTYAVALLASAGFAFVLSRQGELSPQRAAAALAVASLMFFTHLVYDFVFLIIPLAACLAGPIRRANIFILSAIGFIWYGVKLLPMVPPSVAVLAGFEITVFLLLSGILVMLGRIHPYSSADAIDQPTAADAATL